MRQLLLYSIILLSCKQSTRLQFDIPSTLPLNKISSDSLIIENNLKCINYAIFDEPCLDQIVDKAKKVVRLTVQKRQLETIIVTIQSLTDGGAIISKKVFDPESFHLTSIYTVGYNQSFKCTKKIEPRYDFSSMLNDISQHCNSNLKANKDKIDIYTIEYVENGKCNTCQYISELDSEEKKLIDRILNEIENRSDF